MSRPCARCRNHLQTLEDRAAARPHYDRYAVRCRSSLGVFPVEAAELVLRLAPRDPVRVSVRALDRHMRDFPWSVTKGHLAHVDPQAPGIAATITGWRAKSGRWERPRLYLIEGHHRASVHIRDRTDWTWRVLTPYETFALVSPICRCLGAY